MMKGTYYLKNMRVAVQQQDAYQKLVTIITQWENLLRNRYPNIQRTKEYNDWIEGNGFSCYNKFETYFKFNDKDQAKNVFSNIWGNEIGDKVNKEIIKQNIIIYKS